MKALTKKAAIATLGCKVNQVETSSIAEQLISRGYEIVAMDVPADIYIINTCTVTNRTDFKSRNLIRQALQAKSLNPQAKVIVTGCYAQKERAEILALGEIDLVLDNNSKVDLDAWFETADYHFTDIMQARHFVWKDIDGMHERTRAFLKVQDGCDFYCTYCAVPYGRGHSRSMAMSDAVTQATKLVEKGYQEIVLTGINIGLYHDTTSGKRLSALIEVLIEIDGLKLLRLSSIEPQLWTDELLQIIRDNPVVCPHFHIPLQSGSDSVLGRMGRHYQTTEVKQLVEKLLTIRRDCAIGFDVICGFPGETDEEFRQTYDFIKSLPIAYLHVFGYSKRKGTPAATMPSQVHGTVSKERVNALVKLSDQKKQAYIASLIANQIPLTGVIEKVEEQNGSALSDHYIRLYYNTKDVLVNQLVTGISTTTQADGVIITH